MTPEFAYSTSRLAYGVVHRVRGTTAHGNLLSFCRNRIIIAPKPVATVADIRHRRLCAHCFHRRERSL